MGEMGELLKAQKRLMPRAGVEPASPRHIPGVITIRPSELNSRVPHLDHKITYNQFSKLFSHMGELFSHDWMTNCKSILHKFRAYISHGDW